MDMKQALFELSACAGPSGAEQGVSETAKALLKPFVRSATRDVLGNVVAFGPPPSIPSAASCWTPIWTRWACW